MSEHIRTRKVIQSNVRINICDQYIRMLKFFKYLSHFNLNCTLNFELCTLNFKLHFKVHILIALSHLSWDGPALDIWHGKAPLSCKSDPRHLLNYRVLLVFVCLFYLGIVYLFCKIVYEFDELWPAGNQLGHQLAISVSVYLLLCMFAFACLSILKIN